MARGPYKFALQVLVTFLQEFQNLPVDHAGLRDGQIMTRVRNNLRPDPRSDPAETSYSLGSAIDFLMFTHQKERGHAQGFEFVVLQDRGTDDAGLNTCQKAWARRSTMRRRRA
jgi:hypothetical protein